MMSDNHHLENANDLTQAVERLHKCQSKLREKVEIKEEFEGEVVWEGTVHVFDIDHPDSNICYAWSSPIEGSSKRKFYAVLHVPPVDSPEAAVRASIVSDYKKSGPKLPDIEPQAATDFLRNLPDRSERE